MLDNFQADFAKSDWVKIPLGSVFWRMVHGKHEFLQQIGRVRFTCPMSFGRELFRGTLGTRFEIRGKFTLSRGERRGGLGFYFGHPPVGVGLGSASWWTVRIDNRGGENSADFAEEWGGHGDKQVKFFPWKDGSDFLLQRDQEKITLTVDGKKLFTKKIPPETTGDAEAFGISIIGAGVGAWADMWDVEVRKLND